jgi:hypothetical protein
MLYLPTSAFLTVDASESGIDAVLTPHALYALPPCSHVAVMSQVRVDALPHVGVPRRAGK